MFRTLRKAAASLEKGMETAFSTAPPSHTAFTGTTLTIATIKLKLGPVFAEGGYSLIHIAKPLSSASPSTTTRYAVKRISCADPDARNQAEHEIAFLRQLPPHPNIVRFYDAIFENHHAFLLFELVDGGTLPERLNSSSLDPRRRLSIFADAVAAVTHLHAQSPPVAVRDVKLENLLFDRLQGCYKLCDFGSVTTKAGRPASRKEILAVEEDVASNCTAMYRAPELVDLYSKQFICELVDVWALGCVWYAILFGTLPFDGQSSLQISKGLQHIPSQPTYPDEFIALLKGMLTVDPAARLDSFSVLETVARLEGREIDNNLQRIGLELRKKRSRNFGNTAPLEPTPLSSNLLMGNNDLPPPLVPASQPSHMPAPLSSDLDALSDSFTLQGNVSQNSKDDASSWADFDSAFGDTPSTSRDTAVCTRSATNAMQLSTLPSVGRNRKVVSTTTNPSSSLLDFSDLQISQQPHRPSSTSNLNDLTAAQSRPKDDKSTSAVVDLIDFG